MQLSLELCDFLLCFSTRGREPADLLGIAQMALLQLLLQPHSSTPFLGKRLSIACACLRSILNRSHHHAGFDRLHLSELVFCLLQLKTENVDLLSESRRFCLRSFRRCLVSYKRLRGIFTSGLLRDACQS